jgi:hypothetical protein
LASDAAWTADEWRQFEFVFLGGLDQPLEHADQTVDGLVAARLLVAMPPQLELADVGFRQVIGIFQLQANHDLDARQPPGAVCQCHDCGCCFFR